ncbi:MAG: glutathione S-transferase [Phenylobacterium sp.]|jgi:glutathione S-transferase|uniref:glutathione S-transferase family protein n=1 Tax=Phenylobacterium sp. TaxID=1871053 RepID=UPI0026308771|nr:glutathione S-transferase family protein [Phenylobacterium sp.]MDB5426623.1 glutathione S-transferase [Phenylobacterium sp.]MDB5496375.1 glutathione S-transferase [Phenylobacterium sp.]
MKVYDAAIAPNPRRVRWVMAEKGVADIEVVPVSIPEGEHKRPDYLAKAGLPNLPMLEMDDGTTITESIAICRYLESRYPEPNLFGRDPKETAVIEMWTRRAEMLVATPFMLGVRLSHPGFAALERPAPEVAAWNQQNALAALNVLDRRLGEGEWLAADRLTIADIVAFIGIDFARIVRLRPPEELTHVTRWAAAMRERPAAKA